jgi:hypothetical protein
MPHESTTIQRVWADDDKDDVDDDHLDNNNSEDSYPADQYLNKTIAWASPVSSFSEDPREVPSLMTDSRLRLLSLLNCVGGGEEEDCSSTCHNNNDDTHESKYFNKRSIQSRDAKKPASILLKKYDNNNNEQRHYHQTPVSCSFLFEEGPIPRSLLKNQLQQQQHDSKQLDSMRTIPSPVAIIKEHHNSDDLLVNSSDTEETTAASDESSPMHKITTALENSNNKNTHRRYTNNEQEEEADDDDDDDSNVSIITTVELDALDAKTQDLMDRFRYLHGQRASPLPIRKIPRSCVSLVRSKFENPDDTTKSIQQPLHSDHAFHTGLSTRPPAIQTNHHPGIVPASTEEESQSTCSSSLTISTVSAADWNEYLHSTPKPSNLCIDVSPRKQQQQQPNNHHMKETRGKRKFWLRRSSRLRRTVGSLLVVVGAIPLTVSMLLFYWTRIYATTGSAPVTTGSPDFIIHDDDACATPTWLQLETMGSVHESCHSGTTTRPRRQPRRSGKLTTIQTKKKWGR